MHISLKAVYKKYGRVRALQDVTLDIQPGQIVALLGPNGAGKTTLLRSLAGIIAPDYGTIQYDDQAFTRGRMDMRSRFMFLPDYPAAYPAMTPLQHIGMVLKIYGRDEEGIEDRVTEVMADLEVLPFLKVPMNTLSRGQLYKTILTPLVALNPELWLVDEPFASGMDPNGIMMFKRYARQAAAAGSTVIYSTQILDAAESLCDRVCVIHRGTIEAFSTMEEIKERMGGDEDPLDQLFASLKEMPE